MKNQKNIINYQKAREKLSSNKSKKMWKKVGSAIALIASIITIIVFLTNKNFPNFFHKNKDMEGQQDLTETQETGMDYFISIAVSDTISSNFEPTKKIVATASADTSNMTISSKSDTESDGPFNMNMESSRRFSFLAVFEEPGEYIVTIAATSEDGESATNEIIIEN